MNITEIVNSFDELSNKNIISEYILDKIPQQLNDSIDVFEYYAEKMAFNNTFLNDDGKFCEDHLVYDEITDYDKLFSYYEKRAHEVSHPLLKIVYLGMVFEFKKKYTKQEMDFKLKKEYIYSICRYIDDDYLPYKNAEPKWVIRAIDLAIRTSNQELIDRVKQTTILYVEKVDKGTLLAIVLDKIFENRNEFEIKEMEIILEKSEKLLEALTKEEGYNFKPSLDITTKLCEYYHPTNNRIKLKESIDRFSIYCHTKLINVSPDDIFTVANLYNEYDFKEDFKREIFEMEKLQNEEAQSCQWVPIDIPITPDKNYEEQESKSWEENLNYILVNLIPDMNIVEEDLKESTKYSVLTSIVPKAIQAPDSSGRTEGRIGGIDDDDDGNKLFWFNFQASYNYGSLKQIIDMFKHKLSKETLLKFLSNSYAFQDINKQILEKIIESFLAKEYLVFIHLIIPQIESAFRNIMTHNGHTTYAKLEKGTETIELLGKILNEEFIKSFLGDNALKFIRIILTDRRFLNIRNAVCHGYFPYTSFNEQNSDLLMLITLIFAKKTQL